eukprot:GHVR01009608.1.p1 GENE.GHVR01009608.1~~GHVR01009608.1.p1  ORF type:complete len:685 (+),score=57.83 GHVR01009608.1:171-2225(+)
MGAVRISTGFPRPYRLATRNAFGMTILEALVTAAAATTKRVLGIIPTTANATRLVEALNASNLNAGLYKAGSEQPKTRIVVATQVADSGANIRNVGIVINSGTIMVEHRGVLEYRTHDETTATQRAGRAGRDCDGECWHLQPVSSSPIVTYPSTELYLREPHTWNALLCIRSNLLPVQRGTYMISPYVRIPDSIGMSYPAGWAVGLARICLRYRTPAEVVERSDTPSFMEDHGDIIGNVPGLAVNMAEEAHTIMANFIINVRFLINEAGHVRRSAWLRLKDGYLTALTTREVARSSPIVADRYDLPGDLYYEEGMPTPVRIVRNFITGSLTDKLKAGIARIAALLGNAMGLAGLRQQLEILDIIQGNEMTPHSRITALQALRALGALYNVRLALIWEVVSFVGTPDAPMVPTAALIVNSNGVMVGQWAASPLLSRTVAHVYRRAIQNAAPACATHSSMIMNHAQEHLGEINVDDMLKLDEDNANLYKYRCKRGRNKCHLYTTIRELHEMVRNHIGLEIVYNEADHNTIDVDVKYNYTRRFFWPVIISDHAAAGLVAYNNSLRMSSFWNDFIRAATGSDSDTPLHANFNKQSFVRKSTNSSVIVLLNNCLSMVNDLELRRVNDGLSRVGVGSRDVVTLSSPSSTQHNGIPSLGLFIGASIDEISVCLMPNDLSKRKRITRPDDDE